MTFVTFVLSLASIQALPDHEAAAIDPDAVLDSKMPKADKSAILKHIFAAGVRVAAAPKGPVKSILDLPALDCTVDEDGKIVLKNASTRAPHRFSLVQLAKIHRDLPALMARVPGLYSKLRVERAEEVEPLRTLLAGSGIVVEGEPVVGPFPVSAKAKDATTTTTTTDAAPAGTTEGEAPATA